MLKRWISEIFGLKSAMTRQIDLLEKEAALQKMTADKLAEAEALKRVARAQSEEVARRVERLRQQAEVLQRDYPELRGGLRGQS